MVSCPACKADWPDGTANCPVCGKEIDTEMSETPWVMIGTVDDQLSADFAKETLSTYEIPAVIISQSGFLGNIGLTLTSFHSGKQALFEISVPTDDADEASEILQLTLGEKWHRKEQ